MMKEKTYSRILHNLQNLARLLDTNRIQKVVTFEGLVTRMGQKKGLLGMLVKLCF